MISNKLLILILLISKGKSENSSEIIQTVIPLSALIRPQYVFSLHSNATEFIFDIDSEIDPSFDWKLSIVVEKINCWRSSNKLILSGPENTTELKFCATIDFEADGYQSTEFVLDDVTWAKVKVFGEGWGQDGGQSAKLVANIYHEVDGSCDACGLDYFCCGTPNSCENTKRNVLSEKYRCIPFNALGAIGGDRKNNLMCNRHPNCGFYCNLDEGREICEERPSGDCVGHYCPDIAQLALKLSVLILLCFLIPPLAIIALCKFQCVRTICDELTRRLSLGRRASQTSSSSSSSSVCPHHHSCPHHHPNVNVTTPVYNPALDPPPSYSDSVTTKAYEAEVEIEVDTEKEPPPPSFDQAMAGISNQAFEFDEIQPT